MQIINFPNYSKIEHDNTIFLMGNNKYPSWQHKFIECLYPHDLKVTLLDPYNKNNQLDKVLQFEWENNGIRISTCVIFWFSNEDFEPIHFITYGNILTENYQKIIVGCDPDFKYKLELEKISELINDEIKLKNSLDELINELVDYIKK